MSKVDADILERSINNIIAFSAGESIPVDARYIEKTDARYKKSKRRPLDVTEVEGQQMVKGKVRNFQETVELQIGLKNYDPSKDKRFSGTFKLPAVPRPNMKICLLGSEVDCERAQGTSVDTKTLEDLKKLNKNKKLVKKLASQYDAFLASKALIKQIPRVLGPGLNRAGKFPTVLEANDDIDAKANEIRATIKFQMKKVMCLNVAVGHVKMEADDLAINIKLAINFLVSLLKKNWQNIRVLYIKSTMGPRQQIYF